MGIVFHVVSAKGFLGSPIGPYIDRGSRSIEAQAKGYEEDFLVCSYLIGT